MVRMRVRLKVINPTASKPSPISGYHEAFQAGTFSSFKYNNWCVAWKGRKKRILMMS